MTTYIALIQSCSKRFTIIEKNMHIKIVLKWILMKTFVLNFVVC